MCMYIGGGFVLNSPYAISNFFPTFYILWFRMCLRAEIQFSTLFVRVCVCGTENMCVCVYVLVVGYVRDHFTQAKISVGFSVIDIVAQANAITTSHEPSNPRFSLRRGERNRAHEKNEQQRQYIGISMNVC